MTRRADILVAGCGPTGLAAALALDAGGFDVVLAGVPAPAPPGRTVALFDGSLRFLDSLGQGPPFAALGAPLRRMRIVDDTPSLFRPPQVDFDAAEIGLAAFGANIEGQALAAELARRVRGRPVAWVEAPVAAYSFGESAVSAGLATGEAIEARLVVAADGRASPAREAAGIALAAKAYPQTALVALLGHDRPHGGASTEFHTREGPFTLVPLPPAPGEPHRSSLVWLTAPARADALSALDDSAFARAAEDQAHSFLGRMRVLGGRGAFPMQALNAARLTAPRLALVGETAHVFPPIGAQGLNLGLRDVAHLAEALVGAADPGAAAPLDAYARLRAGDVATRAAGVDLLNRSLLADLLPVDFLRGAGLVALGAMAPLRRAAMRRGVMPQSGAPKAMLPA